MGRPCDSHIYLYGDSRNARGFSGHLWAELSGRIITGEILSADDTRVMEGITGNRVKRTPYLPPSRRALRKCERRPDPTLGGATAWAFFREMLIWRAWRRRTARSNLHHSNRAMQRRCQRPHRRCIRVSVCHLGDRRGGAGKLCALQSSGTRKADSSEVSFSSETDR